MPLSSWLCDPSDKVKMKKVKEKTIQVGTDLGKLFA